MACSTEFPPPCLGFSGNSAKPLINVIHSSKYAMPFRDQDVVVTTYMHDYIPPVLLPGDCGRTPTIVARPTFGCKNGGATKKFMLDYRHEVLTNSCCRPKIVYGRLPSSFTPWPDVALAAKVIPWPQLRDTPHIRPITLDHKRDCEIRGFYQNCQAHRDYYLDRTDKLYPVPYFNLGYPYPVCCPADERTFKIRRPQDASDIPCFLGSPLHGHRIPCIKRQELASNSFKLPREPFLCDLMKPKSDIIEEVLLV